MELLYSLPENIFRKIGLLQQDYAGIYLDTNVFSVFFLSLSFALISIFLFYSFGKKISAPFQKKSSNYDYLFFIAVGYILTGTGIGFLGIISSLNFITVSFFLAIIIIYSFFPLFSLKDNFIALVLSIKGDLFYLKSKKMVFIWSLLFIILAIIQLINPEIREDQYHVDLPVMYLQNNTIMIPPKEQISVSASPLLSEMNYVVAILFLSKEIARYIHFVFYILVLLTLVNFARLKNYEFAIYAPILFASAPVVIHETSSMYVDFQWIFCFLLSILVLLDQNGKFAMAKSGFLFGGMIATKLWTIVFSIVPVLYLLTTGDKTKNKFVYLLLFFSFATIVSFIWFLRAYILTGSPLYPALNSTDSYSPSSLLTSLSRFIGINYQLIDIFSFINVFSPLFFVSFAFFIYKFPHNFKALTSLHLSKYIFFLLVLYLLVRYPFGRYLLGLYVLFIFINSFAINAVVKFKSIKILINFVLFMVFSYYFINSILVLPYTFGITDKNSYLSRILIRDASSYYDFGKKFDKHISSRDNVAMYNFHGFYYADFRYSDIRFIYDKNQKTLDLLKQKKYTKLLTRYFNLKDLCTEMNLMECDTDKFSLISSYNEYPFFYLYDIK